MPPVRNDARAALLGWQAEQPTNYYDATPNLGRALRTHLGDDGVAAVESRLSEFGATVAQVVDAAAQTQEQAGKGRGSSLLMRSVAIFRRSSSIPRTQMRAGRSGRAH